MLRHRRFRLFWTGNLISTCGVWMQNLAQGWLILRLSDSSFLLGLSGFASLFPTLSLALIGGTLADRFDRRSLLLMTQSGLMLLALLLGLLTTLGIITPAQIIGLVFLSGIAVALNSPAYQAVIPDLVPDKDLTGAVALNSIQFNLARVAGHSLAGIAVVSLGEAGCFYLNGVSYLAMLYALWRISIPSRHIERDTVSFGDRLKEGIRYVRSQRGLLYLILIVGLTSFLGLPYFFLLPAFARDVLQKGPLELGYLMGSVSIGALCGGLCLTGIVHRFERQQVAKISSLMFWATLLGFSLSRVYWLSFSLLVILGFTLVLTVATVNNLLQILTPPEMRGRVMSINGMVLNGVAPLGSLFAGIVAEASSVPAAVAGMSTLGLFATVVIISRLRSAGRSGKA